MDGYSSTNCLDKLYGLKLGNVSFKNYVGEGGYGEVWKVRWKGKLAAGKQLRGFLFDTNARALERFLGEYDILRRLSHPNIIKMFGLEIVEGHPPIMIMELMHQDLDTYVHDSRTEPKVQLKDAIGILLGVAKGLNYLHTLSSPLRPVIHRDLSSKNILLDKMNFAKITDLGQAKISPDRFLEEATPKPGFWPYLAPETYSLHEHNNPRAIWRVTYGSEVDIFSFGVVALEVIIGRRPRPEERINPRDNSIVSERTRRRADLDKLDLLHPMREIILQCLDDDPAVRPQASNLVDYLQKWKDGNQRLLLKIIVLGNSGVGKTALLKRYIDPAYPFNTTKATIDGRIEFVPVNYRELGIVTLQICDTAGMERFNSIPPAFFRGAHGVFVVYDVTDPKSFVQVNDWIEKVHRQCDESVRVILVGNKVDKERYVSLRRAEDYAERNHMEYIETSARTMENVEMMFELMKEKLLEGLDRSEENIVSSVVSLTQPKPKEQKNCCQ